jgi:hypothetical protein
MQGLTDRRVLMITALCFCLVSGNFGVVFWMPQIIKAFGGISNMEVGLLTALPYALAMIAMVVGAPLRPQGRAQMASGDGGVAWLDRARCERRGADADAILYRAVFRHSRDLEHVRRVLGHPERFSLRHGRRSRLRAHQ